jgi:hypothetical protein
VLAGTVGAGASRVIPADAINYGCSLDCRETAEQEAAREAQERGRQREAAEAQERAAKEAAERTTQAWEAQEREARETKDRAAGEHATPCVVPQLKGDSLAAARRALAKANCAMGKVSKPTTHRGRLVVRRQGTHAGVKLGRGASVAVTLGVSAGATRR